MSFAYYTEHQQKALEALALYRFLTPAQFVKLGIAASADAVRKNVLRPLSIRNKNPIRSQDVGRFMGASHIWCLTENGVKDLANAWKMPVEKIPYPKGGIQFGSQYFHRVAQIDFHIHLRLWAREIGAEVLLSDLDFIMKGAQRLDGQTSVCKVTMEDGSFYIPDGIFGFRFENNLFLYALEVHHTMSTQRIVAKLQNYYKILMEGAISAKYNYNLNCYVLNVFEQERLTKDHAKNVQLAKNKMGYVKDRLLADQYFAPFQPAFLFNTMESVRADITQGWTRADGQESSPF